MADEAPEDSKPRTYATNEEMVAVAKVSRDTLYKWVRDKMLPRPKITSDGRGTRSLWPLEALERARFIVERRARVPHDGGDQGDGVGAVAAAAQSLEGQGERLSRPDET
jgi:hypothetical protein